MSAVISDNGLPVLNDALCTSIGGGSPATVHLFTSPTSLSPPDFVPSTFTDATSTGYAPQPLVFAGNPGPVPPYESNTGYFVANSFVSPAPNGETLQGYYVLSQDGLTVLFAEMFAAPIIWNLPLTPIVVAPSFTFTLVPPQESIMLLATVDDIPLTVAGATPLLVVPASKTLVVTLMEIRITTLGTPANTGTYACIRLSDSAMLLNQSTTNAGIVANGVIGLSQDTQTTYTQVLAGDTVEFSVGEADAGTGVVAAVDLFGYFTPS